MFASRELSVSLLLFLILVHDSATQQYPAIVEFDVVFPRNETYAPTALMPIVFAIQNPKAVVPLTMTIKWDIGRFGAEPEWLDTGVVDLADVNLSTNPFFVILGAQGLDTEGIYAVHWTVKSANCSGDTYHMTIGGDNETHFSISSNGSQPSLVTGADTCPDKTITYNITGTTLDTEDSGFNSRRNRCAIISDQRPPANPCAINIDEAQASSMSSAMSAAATCATDTPSPTGGCLTPPAPPASTTKASLASKLRSGGMNLTGVLFGLGLGLLFWALQYQ